MKLLALETSSLACSLALKCNQDLIAIHKILPRQQTQFILPLIDELLKSHNVSLNQLDAIAFGCGPGSFTGVRMAASVAQGLAFPLQLPVIPISSLAALAQAAYAAHGWNQLYVAVDARMQEIYGATYIISAGLACLVGKEWVIKPADIPFPEVANQWYGVGNGWDIYQSLIPFNPLIIDSTQLPTAAAIIPLAEKRYLEGQWVSPIKAYPCYIRDQVVK